MPPPQTLKSPPPPLSHVPEAYISDVEGQTTKGRTKHGEWIRSAHRRPGRISARVTAHPGGFGLQYDIDTYSVAYVHELYKIRTRGRLTRLYRREPTHPLAPAERDHPSFVAQNQLIVHCEHSGMMICSRYVSVPSRLSPGAGSFSRRWTFWKHRATLVCAASRVVEPGGRFVALTVWRMHVSVAVPRRHCGHEAATMATRTRTRTSLVRQGIRHCAHAARSPPPRYAGRVALRTRMCIRIRTRRRPSSLPVLRRRPSRRRCEPRPVRSSAGPLARLPCCVPARGPPDGRTTTTTTTTPPSPVVP